ncbi:hypothetical protein [Streptomyces sp. UH6]|uniref:hypothetical protein n=1 Tax=Streptomyces sp. UH6 TaxID=2748379 RepID=UPI0015D4BB69|nr:hypothetical protein [Streptomyces sp. UH6]NYV72985.1 hypothetical protein [Streptomyces sp. UH6]
MPLVAEAIDALVALGQGDPALADVLVLDGPLVSDSNARELLIVGYDGDPNGDFEAASTTGEFADLGTGREEVFQVTVAALVSNGASDVRAARVRAYEIGGRVTAWLRADPSIGLGLGRVLTAIESTRLRQEQTVQGVQAVLLMSVVGRGMT